MIGEITYAELLKENQRLLDTLRCRNDEIHILSTRLNSVLTRCDMQKSAIKEINVIIGMRDLIKSDELLTILKRLW